MKVSLPKQLLEFLEGQVKSGKYATMSDAIAAGVRSLRESALEDQRLDELGEFVLAGIEQARRGEVGPPDLDAIKAEGRKRRLDRSRRGQPGASWRNRT